jgi:hypothetical protein
MERKEEKKGRKREMKSFKTDFSFSILKRRWV